MIDEWKYVNINGQKRFYTLLNAFLYFNYDIGSAYLCNNMAMKLRTIIHVNCLQTERGRWSRAVVFGNLMSFTHKKD
jgi:hypothetical protein